MLVVNTGKESVIDPAISPGPCLRLSKIHTIHDGRLRMLWICEGQWEIGEIDDIVAY